MIAGDPNTGRTPLASGPAVRALLIADSPGGPGGSHTHAACNSNTSHILPPSRWLKQRALDRRHWWRHSNNALHECLPPCAGDKACAALLETEPRQPTFTSARWCYQHHRAFICPSLYLGRVSNVSLVLWPGQLGWAQYCFFDDEQDATADGVGRGPAASSSQHLYCLPLRWSHGYDKSSSVWLVWRIRDSFGHPLQDRAKRMFFREWWSIH